MDIQKINYFLRPCTVIIDSNGNGNGNGNGYGDSYGYGNGNGYGNDNGNGYGNGDGNGIKKFNNQIVYIIDNQQTIITSIKNDVAKGYLLNKDLTLTSCFIVRNDYCYAHGSTLKEALKSLDDKTTLTLPVEKRIENFKNQFKNYNLKIKASLLYDWHFKLTGSCKMGRDSFCSNNSINLQKDKFTINEFIKLTENEYNGHIIKLLK